MLEVRLGFAVRVCPHGFGMIFFCRGFSEGLLQQLSRFALGNSCKGCMMLKWLSILYIWYDWITKEVREGMKLIEIVFAIA